MNFQDKAIKDQHCAYQQRADQQVLSRTASNNSASSAARVFFVITDPTLKSPYKLLCFKTERGENSELTQRLYTSLDLQYTLLKFISLTPNFSNNNELVMKILQAIYHLLTMLIWNNNFNKQYFIDNKDLFIPHLAYNVGCAEFIRELYLNQKYLLS